VVDGVRGARRALATRRAMSKTAAARVRALRALKPLMVAGAARHARERLI
jgi:hypothetical protein